MEKPNSAAVKGYRMLTALGLHSAALIAWQLALMQLISYMQGYHFAYMIISIAMLGFGAGGTFLALWRTKLLANASWLVPVLMAASGLSMVLVFRVSVIPLLAFDVHLLFVERSHLGTLAVHYLLYFFPFFTGALAIGILFIQHAQSIGRYYFSNLLGSGVGGVLVIFLLSVLFAEKALPIIAILPVLSAILAIGPIKKPLQIAAILVAGLAVSAFLFADFPLPVSQYKGISRTLNLPHAEITHKEAGIHGVIEVITSPALRYAPALSFRYRGEVPAKSNIFVNADTYGALHSFLPEEQNIHDYTTEALPYVAGKREKVLIAGAVTGGGIAHALHNGAEEVVAVFENAGILSLLTNELSEQTNAGRLPQGVKLLYSDLRQFLFQSAGAQYDAIILPRMESFGGSTGINALREEYALTLEAFMQMWEMLSPYGVISITSWIDFPPRTTLKTALTLRQALEKSGISKPEDHFAVIRSWGTLSTALKKTPFTMQEKQSILEFCEEMFFDVVFLPGINTEDHMQHNMLEDETMQENLLAIFTGNYAELPLQYPFYIEPATDDKPYFGRFLKASTLKQITEVFGAETLPFLELGYLILWVTLLQSSLLAFILIILPLFRLRKTGRGKLPVILYFGALGIGYMFVEIIFIQRFVLYFGHPVYAITAVIGTMLISSGAGSLFSARYTHAGYAARFAAIVITLLLIVYSLFLTKLLTLSIHFPFPAKVMIALLLIALPSFFMGMPFPSGIRLLSKDHQSLIPWGWGINGCLSVIATSLATLLAVEHGFQLVVFLAALCYGGAFGVVYFWNAAKT